MSASASGEDFLHAFGHGVSQDPAADVITFSDNRHKNY
jgi:hypothetical protein